MWNKFAASVKNYFSKENIFKNIKNLILILTGTLILGVGSGFFLIPFQIISGGMTGITILTAGFIAPDTMSYILSWAFFVIGLLILGPKFTISSLISTIFYPVFISLIMRTGVLDSFIPLLVGSANGVKPIIENGIIQNLADLNVDNGLLLIIGILGGALVGIGCSITFHGGGSTGGLDILTFIISKYTGIKESIPFFILDGTVVGIGIIIDVVLGDHLRLISGVIGIIAAFICSMLVEVVYSGQTSAYVVDIISSKHKEIVEEVFKTLDRSATIFKVIGAYSNEEKTMIRVCFSRREYVKIKNLIARIDPQAFCTFSQTLFVGGEGFDRIKTTEPESIKIIKQIKNNAKSEQKEEK